MPAIKMSAVKIFAGLTASAFFTPISFAATLLVNNEAPLNVNAPGFSYVAQGSNAGLTVPTDGFLFCANVYVEGDQPDHTPVTLLPEHGDWRFPSAQDVKTVAYNAGVLGVNQPDANQTSLVCHSIGAQGEILTSLSDGLFRNSYETKTAEQYRDLINWIPSPGFDWTNPDWSAVPTDPCSPSAQQPAQVVEDVACAGATGTRPAGAGATVRAATMWTGTDGSNFFYVARIDARYGVQPLIDGGMKLPQTANPDDTNVALWLVDSYDRGVVGVGGGYLADTGQWCFLTDLPSTLTGNLCSGALTSGPLNGPMSSAIYLSVLTSSNVSFYAAFIRPIVGSPPALTEPAVAVSILLEPSVTAVGGDKFKGDDVAFGFLPNSPGFPWMYGQ
jgi:hypothetical protein